MSHAVPFTVQVPPAKLDIRSVPVMVNLFYLPKSQSVNNNPEKQIAAIIIKKRNSTIMRRRARITTLLDIAKNAKLEDGERESQIFERFRGWCDSYRGNKIHAPHARISKPRSEYQSIKIDL
jgi:hypothetical protein